MIILQPGTARSAGRAGTPTNFIAMFVRSKKSVIKAFNLDAFNIPFSILALLKFNDEPFHRSCSVRNINLMGAFDLLYSLYQFDV